jgi:hypothetical protein
MRGMSLEARHCSLMLSEGPPMMKTPRLLPAMMMVAGLWMTAPACAAQTYGYPSGGYGRDIERRAYDNGYRDGVRDGERDARSGRAFSYNRHDEWRDADNGYSRGYGDRDFYRRSFRSGFEAGYSESYKRYGNYGRSPRPDYRPVPAYPSYPGGVAVPRAGYSPAAQTGYRDGLDAGRDDAHDRKAYDPVRVKRYRDGDHEYNSRYGSRDEYKREYRAAFEQGYRDGYGQYRR